MYYGRNSEAGNWVLKGLRKGSVAGQSRQDNSNQDEEGLNKSPGSLGRQDKLRL